MHRLVCECPPLDVNSLYVYLLLSEHFSQTCIIAEDTAGLCGMVSAYTPPERPNTLFVWQVAVAEHVRGVGLAGRMVRALLRRPGLQSIQYIETTVSPGNQASRGMFARLASSLGTRWEEHALFDAHLFGAGGHEAEPLLRIGPFDVRREDSSCNEYSTQGEHYGLENF